MHDEHARRPYESHVRCSYGAVYAVFILLSMLRRLAQGLFDVRSVGPTVDDKCDSGQGRLVRMTQGNMDAGLEMQLLFFQIILVDCSIGDERLREAWTRCHYGEAKARTSTSALEGLDTK